MTKNVKLIARFAIIAALVVVSYSLDAAISMAGLPVRIAVVTLIVVLTIAQQFNLLTSIYTCTCFGLMSFLFAWFLPNLTSAAFRNPLISILPRLLIGITSYSTMKGLRRAFELRRSVFAREIFPRALASIIGVLTNTVIVVAMIAIFGGQDIIMSVINVLVGVNFIIEFLSGLLIVPSISCAISRQVRRLNI